MIGEVSARHRPGASRLLRPRATLLLRRAAPVACRAGRAWVRLIPVPAGAGQAAPSSASSDATTLAVVSCVHPTSHKKALPST